jgi:hypothetical protein
MRVSRLLKILAGMPAEQKQEAIAEFRLRVDRGEFAESPPALRE